MGGYRISELAERTGFPASTLRFYEQEGLLPAAERTPAGYRSYDERTVERLRFIARAKQLDLPLDEIRELGAVWDAGSCAPVQQRLTDLVTVKITDVDARVAELIAFRAQLVAARDGLARHTADGPCDDLCGCVIPTGLSTASLTAQLPASASTDPLPTERGDDEAQAIACTLDAADQDTRMQDWERLVGAATRRERVDGGVLLTLPVDPELIGQVARLAALEQQCCPFFTFTIDLPGDTVALTVRAPADANDVLDALIGA